MKTKMATDRWRRLGLATGFFLALAIPASAEGCGKLDHDGQSYTICQIDAAEESRLRLWQNDASGQPLNGFSAVRRTLAPGEKLRWAMNAGMFHPDYQPVGLLVIDGEEQHGIVTAGGGGNFGMLPNGVFCSGGDRPFQVIESRAFAAAQPDCRLATQSGPMLVIDGELHPRFLVDSDSRYIRNGVGVSPDGQTAWFAISDRPVTFHEFGRLFRDGFGRARGALFRRLDQPALRAGPEPRRFRPQPGADDRAG